MPVRVRNFHSKILIALPLLGVWAGLASGSLGAGAEGADPTPPETDQAAAPALAATSVPALPAAAAADALAVDDVTGAAATAISPAEAPAVSPATALVPSERLYLEPILTQAARDYGLPVDLILAQAWAESGWRVDAVSNKGAVGVLQIMPSVSTTAAWARTRQSRSGPFRESRQKNRRIPHVFLPRCRELVRSEVPL